MNSLVNEYWPLVLIGAVLAALLLYFVLRPRQRVRLGDSAPTRPHMAYAAKDRATQPGPGHGIADEAAAAAGDVTRDVLQAPSREAGGSQDDLERLKGVGPRFADMLRARGIARFEHIAHLGPEEVERLDAELGPFRGRLSRDRIVEQAQFLARGDEDGFEQRFGKL